MKKMFSQLIPLSLCLASLVSCGAKTDKSELAKYQDKLVTANYQDLLQGTFNSPLGHITFEEGNNLTIKSWVNIRNLKNSGGVEEVDYYLNCQVERKGTYEIIKSGINNDLRFVMKPTSVVTSDVNFENRGTKFEITSATKPKALSLCDEFFKNELKKKMESKLVSVSEDHIHFYYDGNYSEYDDKNGGWKSEIYTMGDDYSNFYAKNEDTDITSVVGKLFEGTFANARPSEYEGKRLKLTKTEDGKMSYKYSGEKCTSKGKFEIHFNTNKGLDFYFLENDQCFTNAHDTLTVHDIGRSKDEKEYIYLILPFGFFDKIIQKPYSIRD